MTRSSKLRALPVNRSTVTLWPQCYGTGHWRHDFLGVRVTANGPLQTDQPSKPKPTTEAA
ncbi:MAG: hypothetical protein RLZZ591_1672 [Pseudomonadota bacterium]|jgi:hypothetical protein